MVVLPAGYLEEEPNATFALIYPIFEKAGSSNIACIIADCVDRSHARDQGLLVLAKLAQHILRSRILCIVVQDALQASDVSDGTDAKSFSIATESAIA